MEEEKKKPNLLSAGRIIPSTKGPGQDRTWPKPCSTRQSTTTQTQKRESQQDGITLGKGEQKEEKEKKERGKKDTTAQLNPQTRACSSDRAESCLAPRPPQPLVHAEDGAIGNSEGLVGPYSGSPQDPLEEDRK